MNNYCYWLMIGMVIRSYRDDRVTGGDGEDFSAGDSLVAHGLHLRLDVVEDAEASQRVSGSPPARR